MSIDAGSSSQSASISATASSAWLRGLGDHRAPRLALPARAIDRDRVLRRRLDALQMREHATHGVQYSATARPSKTPITPVRAAPP
jgi:hypothetical protein